MNGGGRIEKKNKGFAIQLIPMVGGRLVTRHDRWIDIYQLDEMK